MGEAPSGKAQLAPLEAVVEREGEADRKDSQKAGGEEVQSRRQ